MARAVLSGPVGRGQKATNRPADVRSVQHLLNVVGQGAKTPEDGNCTPALVARITSFQRDVLRFPNPDGRVDPTGRTLKVLLARAAEKARHSPPAAKEPSLGQWWASNLTAMGKALQSMFDDNDKTSRASTPTVGGKIATAASGAGGALTDRDYADAAARLGRGIDPLLVRACAQVESGGRSGFGPGGLPIIAYEGHWFRKLTKKLYDETHPLLSYPYVKKAGWQWQKNNKDQSAAWATLKEAMALNADAALQSTSWGMCQVMGFNYKKCGYKDVFAFVEAMKAGPKGQLEAFVGYCLKTPGMVSALQSKNFAAMAYAYNGEDYGNYDKLFEAAYKKLGGKV
jgi:hypothetical protein